MTLRFSHI